MGRALPVPSFVTGGDSFGPSGNRQEDVEQGSPWRSDQCGGVPASHSSEPFAQIPHATRPQDRARDGHTDRASEEEAQPEADLDGGETAVQENGVRGDQPRIPLDRCGDEEGLPMCRGGDDRIGKTFGEHEGLHLEDPVKQPQKPEGNAEGPTGK